MTGLVLSGSNNVYTVALDDGREMECSLKGKIVKELTGYYNALVPGDRVQLDGVDVMDGASRIIAAEPRRNAYTRWNQKGKAPQVFAVNLDFIVCVATPDYPPFRPRFLDRALVQADIVGIPPIVVVNKSDLENDDPDLAERLEDYRRIGYSVLRTSTITGEGIAELRQRLVGKTSVLVGQSGVGKSSLLNTLVPGAALKTAALSHKHRRGVHTTTRSGLFTTSNAAGLTAVIDTPGIRRLVLEGASLSGLALHFPEFAPIVGTCTFGLSCAHLNEPGCRILEAVAAGIIHEDRYNSYLSLREELVGRKPSWEQE